MLVVEQPSRSGTELAEVSFGERRVSKLCSPNQALGSRRLSLFVPMRNEEDSVGNFLPSVLDYLKQAKIDFLVLVLDGCTDRTPQLVYKALGLDREEADALEENLQRRFTVGLDNQVLLIRHAKAAGKGRSFLEAVFSLKGWSDHFACGDSALVCMDGDISHSKLFNPESILALANELWQREHPMVLGRQEEWFPVTGTYDRAPAESTCFRAMRSTALTPMLTLDRDWIRVFPARFGMDLALNLLVSVQAERMGVRSPRLPVAEVPVYCHLPFRHVRQGAQERQRELVRSRFGDVVGGQPYRFPLGTTAKFAFSERLEALRNKEAPVLLSPTARLLQAAARLWERFEHLVDDRMLPNRERKWRPPDESQPRSTEDTVP